jgi:Protein of unknown function (DUF1573)
MQKAIFYIAWIVASVLVSSNTIMAFTDDQEHDQHKLKLVKGDSIQIHRISLGDVSAGQKINFKLYVSNASKDSIAFKNVTVGCKCTQAAVPEIKLDPDASTEFQFQFEIDKQPRRTDILFQVKIDCEGMCDLMVLDFEAHIKDVVNFAVPGLVHRFSYKLESDSFDVPLVISDPSVWDSLEISCSKELAFLVIEKTRKNDGFSLGVRFKSKDLVENTITGDLILKRPGMEEETRMSCVLQKESAYAVFPQNIIFSAAAEGGFEASAILKNNDGAQLPDDFDVSCSILNEGKTRKIEVRKAVINQKLCKINLQSEEWDSMNSGGYHLEWVVIANGRNFKFTTPVSFLIKQKR